MAANPDNEQVNQLIAEKRYEEAKAILRQSSDPAAQKWLERLEQLYPPPAPVSRSQPTSDYGSYGLGMATGYGRTSSSSYSYPATYERGGCLTAWLVVLGGLNAFAVVWSLYSGSFLQLIFSAFVVACIVGVWYRKTWGFYGWMASYIFAILLGLLLVESLQYVVGALIGLTITYVLVKPQLDQFD
jgi:hypothetical protein